MKPWLKYDGDHDDHHLRLVSFRSKFNMRKMSFDVQNVFLTLHAFNLGHMYTSFVKKSDLTNML